MELMELNIEVEDDGERNAYMTIVMKIDGIKKTNSEWKILNKSMPSAIIKNGVVIGTTEAGVEPFEAGYEIMRKELDARIEEIKDAITSIVGKPKA